MKEILIYHGSERIIKNPTYGFGNKNNDYGLGFYCTKNLDIVKEWANKSTSYGYVNKYKMALANLKVLDLTNKNEYSVLNWIAILLHHRNISLDIKERYRRRLAFLETNYYIDVSKYDLIIGYRADDAYFKFPMLFVQNELSIEKLEEIYNLGNLGVQIVLISELSFSRLKYIESISVDSRYHDMYLKRKNDADNRFEEIRIEEINNDNRKIEDLIKEYDKHK